MGKWFVNGQRVSARYNGAKHLGTVAEPHGDYSWVTLDDDPKNEQTLIRNDDMSALPVDGNPT